MPLYNIQLSSRLCVTVSAVHVSETNEGLEGPPSHITNRWECDTARAEAQRIWPGVPVYLILPESYISLDTYFPLPKWRLTALLLGEERTEQGSQFSVLVI